MSKLVSIITVSYQSAGTIRKTIESVVGQTYQNLQYIIIDGASTDGTVDIIREFQSKYPDLIQYISEKDNGIYDAMNKGIDLAKGELIGILNSDDYYEDTAVQSMVESMQENPYQILYGFLRTIREGEEYRITRHSPKFIRENMIEHPSTFVTKAVYEKYGKFDLQYVSVADYDFMLRMSSQSDISFVPVNHVITNFSLGGMSASNTAWLDLLKLKRNYQMISLKEYRKEILRNRVYMFLKRKK